MIMSKPLKTAMMLNMQADISYPFLQNIGGECYMCYADSRKELIEFEKDE
jgi:hypothetical protein